MSVNKVILLGNLGKDPETRYLDRERVVSILSIATSETYTNRNGEKKTDTEWHRVELWDEMARIAEKYLRKGAPVYIEGKIRTETWKDKDGNDRTGIKIRATSMNLIGSSKTNESSDPPTVSE